MKRLAVGPACALILALHDLPAAQANGNSLPRAAAESLGMADANVALISGPAATFINPANLGDDTHARWSTGSLAGTARAQYTRSAPAGDAAAGDYDSERSYPLVPYAAVSGAWDRHLAWGFAIDAPHGLGTEWADHTWDVGGSDLYRESDLAVLRVGPAVAWSPSERLSVGARVFAQYVEAKEISDFTAVEGDGTDVGFQLGIRYRLPRLILAAAYASRTNTRLEGDFTARGVNERVNTDFLLPDRLQAGIAWRLTADVWWEFDIDRFGWSYVDELAIRTDAGVVINPDSAARRNRDTTTLRTGVRWRRTADLTLQAGVGYDPTPVPDVDVNPTGSILRKTRLALGALWTLDPDLRLDLAYQYVHGHTRGVSESRQDDAARLGGDTGVYAGNYASDAHIWAIGLSGRF